MTHIEINALADVMFKSEDQNKRVDAAEKLLAEVKVPSHIEIEHDLLPLTGRKEQVLDDITGFVEHYDFSRANSSYEARVQAVTKVASICYGNPKSLGSINLFNRLEAESHGLPSSSYEFVPVLLDKDICTYDHLSLTDFSNSIKFGEFIERGTYLLTNLRALISDVGVEESLKYLNTSEEEIQIIKDNFKVFLFNVDLSTRAQMVRHRVSWQELSRRYVSGKKTPFEFYVSKGMDKYFTTEVISQGESSNGLCINVSLELYTRDIIEICTDHYYKALEAGIKPEEARRILPQAMMTTIWGAFQPSQLDNWFQLRLDSHAQREIRQVSEAMKELVCLKTS